MIWIQIKIVEQVVLHQDAIKVILKMVILKLFVILINIPKEKDKETNMRVAARLLIWFDCYADIIMRILCVICVIMMILCQPIVWLILARKRTCIAFSGWSVTNRTECYTLKSDS